jgi:hypothetical protein
VGTSKIMDETGASCFTSPLSRVSMRNCGDHRSQRAKRVETLRAAPLAVLLLEVACGHVVAARVPQNHGGGLLGRQVASAFADHHRQLTFVVHAPRHALRIHDRFLRSQHRAGRLKKDQGLVGHVLLEFCGVVLVIDPDGDDLGRQTRREHAHGGERHGSTVRSVTLYAPNRSPSMTRTRSPSKRP